MAFYIRKKCIFWKLIRLTFTRDIFLYKQYMFIKKWFFRNQSFWIPTILNPILIHSFNLHTYNFGYKLFLLNTVCSIVSLDSGLVGWLVGWYHMYYSSFCLPYYVSITIHSSTVLWSRLDRFRTFSSNFYCNFDTWR